MGEGGGERSRGEREEGERERQREAGDHIILRSPTCMMDQRGLACSRSERENEAKALSERAYTPGNIVQRLHTEKERNRGHKHDR